MAAGGEKRWPPPWVNGKRSMEPVVADAYSRLAAGTRRVSEIAAEVLLVVGGAWLGVTLPKVWSDYRGSAAKATQNLRAHTGEFLPDVTWAQYAHFVPALLITLGATLLVLAREYEQVEHIYREAAVPDAPQVKLTTAGPEASQSRVLLFVRRLLRSV